MAVGVRAGEKARIEITALETRKTKLQSLWNDEIPVIAAQKMLQLPEGNFLLGLQFVIVDRRENGDESRQGLCTYVRECLTK